MARAEPARGVATGRGGAASRVRLRSLERSGINASTVFGPQLTGALATHLNGERLSLDHGYR